MKESYLLSVRFGLTFVFYSPVRDKTAESLPMV